MLQDDSRFKNVEDAHDREDLFNDFVSELEKKEKEDRCKHRDAALKHLSVLYDELLNKGTCSHHCYMCWHYCCMCWHYCLCTREYSNYYSVSSHLHSIFVEHH